ncbi:hypothetical protein H0H81_012324, partial [Sphagnurus paluster]
MLCRRYKDASEMRESAEHYYQNLVTGLSPDDVAQWRTDIELAEGSRLKDISAMDIMKARVIDTHAHGIGGANHTTSAGFTSPDQEWVQMGIDLEERQLALQDCVKRLETEPCEEDEKAIEEERRLLGIQLAKFLAAQPRQNMHCVPINIDPVGNPPGFFDDMEETNLADPADAPVVGSEAGMVTPEDTYLPLPLRSRDCDSPLAPIEIQLREHQAQQQLAALRETIAKKSFIYSHVMRVTHQTAVRTHARSTMAKLDTKLSSMSRAYAKCCVAMVRLQANEHILEKYQILLKSDIKSSTALLDPNQSGSSNVTLSWIWQINELNTDSPEALRE